MNTTTALNVDRNAIIATLFQGDTFIKFTELKEKVDNFTATPNEEGEFFKMRFQVNTAIVQKEKEPKMNALKEMAKVFQPAEVLNALGYDKKAVATYLKTLDKTDNGITIAKVMIDGIEFAYINGKRYGAKGTQAEMLKKFKALPYATVEAGLTEEGKTFLNTMNKRKRFANLDKFKAMFKVEAPKVEAVKVETAKPATKAKTK